MVAYIPDLLFGSAVLSALQQAGHEAVLVGDPDALERALPGTAVLVVDLTSDVPSRLHTVRGYLGGPVKTVAFYSHVHAEVRTQALGAGFDLVVPRSRMAREGTELIERLSTGR